MICRRKWLSRQNPTYHTIDVCPQRAQSSALPQMPPARPQMQPAQTRDARSGPAPSPSSLAKRKVQWGDKNYSRQRYSPVGQQLSTTTQQRQPVRYSGNTANIDDDTDNYEAVFNDINGPAMSPLQLNTMGAMMQAMATAMEQEHETPSGTEDQSFDPTASDTWRWCSHVALVAGAKGGYLWRP